MGGLGKDETQDTCPLSFFTMMELYSIHEAQQLPSLSTSFRK